MQKTIHIFPGRFFGMQGLQKNENKYAGLSCYNQYLVQIRKSSGFKK